MKRLMSTMKKKKSGSPTPNGDSARSSQMPTPQGDAPEAVIVRSLVAFCESGAPGSQSAGDEYLHLPPIVDAAESSPTAAREAANTIARYLSKENYQKGYAQYNAIMIMRILTDNPGQHFTQHFNDNFVSTVKRLLRDCRDGNVQQITRETLDYFEAQKLSQQPGLTSLMNMWTKEKAKGARFLQQPVYPNGMQIGHSGHGGHGGHRSHRHTRQLPPPDELAARIEEAKTTARLLIQTVQSTPQSELMANELVKEFAERARSAHKSVSNYMSCDNPPPDEDTMLTLIETNDQLNVAMSKHQRALLQARKAAGLASPTPPSGQGQEANNYMQASGPMTPHVAGQNVYGNVYGQPSPPHHQHPSSTISPVSPMNHNNETFSAPSGPPPRQIPQNNTSFTPPPGPPPSQFRQQTYEYEDAYAPAPHIPPANSTHNRSESRTTDYGVAENPFSDDNAAEHDDAPRPPPKSNPGALFGRSQQQQQQQQQPQPGMMASTPSYMQRQDSSANNLTMHGGSPPPENAGGR